MHTNLSNYVLNCSAHLVVTAGGTSRIQETVTEKVPEFGKDVEQTQKQLNFYTEQSLEHRVTRTFHGPWEQRR